MLLVIAILCIVALSLLQEFSKIQHLALPFFGKHIKLLENLLRNTHGSLYVQVLHFQRVFFNELSSAFDVLAHEDTEEPLGLAGFL